MKLRIFKVTVDSNMGMGSCPIAEVEIEAHRAIIKDNSIYFTKGGEIVFATNRPYVFSHDYGS